MLAAGRLWPSDDDDDVDEYDDVDDDDEGASTLLLGLIDQPWVCCPPNITLRSLMIMMEMVSCLYLYLYWFVFVFAFVFLAGVLPAQYYLGVIDDEEHTGDGEDDVDDGENECTDCAKSS